ncbi:MAG: thioredoxin domain-containing protein [Deltaproteobacteria bacterium]|jgi:thioredoxin 1
MRLRRHAVLGLCGLLGFLLLCSGLPSPGRAAAPGRPALYEFGAGYCAACKEMAKIMADLQAHYGQHLEFRQVYASKDKDLFQKYKIVLIPTQVFLDASGKEVYRHMGALSRDQVINKLKALKFID